MEQRSADAVILYDAFILYNNQDGETVARIVQALMEHGLSTFDPREDASEGASWADILDPVLREAGTILVFLGAAGIAGFNQDIFETAQSLGKQTIVVMLADVPDVAWLRADLYFDFREVFQIPELAAAIQNAARPRLVDEAASLQAQTAQTQAKGEPDARQVDAAIAQAAAPGDAHRFDGIVDGLVDGNEATRSRLLRQIRETAELDRAGLAERLAFEIRQRFSPASEVSPQTVRDPKLVASIRSWMISSLISADERHAHRELLLTQLRPDYEPDHNVRFWTLAGLYNARVPYLEQALTGPGDDPSSQVRALALAIMNPTRAVEQFRGLLQGDFNEAWPALRVLRVIPLPELAPAVCEGLFRSPVGSAFAYDVLYALASRAMAAAAAPVLVSAAGVDRVVQRVIEECRGANPTVVRAFARVLAPLDAAAVDRALAVARQNPATAAIATALAGYLPGLREPGVGQISLPHFNADVIGDVKDDPLGIQEDVQTLTAVIMAREVTPPLAVGLFGDWGTGKSWFMQSVRANAKALADESARTGDRTFCTHVVPIEFNAWHYADTHLLVSLVHHILEKLNAYVSPELTPEQRQEALEREREAARLSAEKAEAELAGRERAVEDIQARLTELRTQRETSEIRLTDLDAADVNAFLEQEPALKAELRSAFQEAGLDEGVASVERLTAAVTELKSFHARLQSAWSQGKQSKVFWVLLVLSLVGVPALVLLLRSLTGSTFFGTMSSLFAQGAALVSAAAVAVTRAHRWLQARVQPLEKAREKVEKVIAQKRERPTSAEVRLKGEVEALEQERAAAAARNAQAATALQELEKRISELQEARGLAYFLADAGRSYQQHLGVVSTIRKHFESLGDRLAAAARGAGGPGNPVDRIILYIDDLDRCPADKVLEVLEAVHLLLAYPLFVVIVGVDPRWLLNSLSDTYTAFQNGGARQNGASARWNITPQNYLEKIFQIPFTLRPMSETGYQNLVDRLFAPARADEEREQPSRQTQKPGENGGGTASAPGTGQAGLAATPPADAESQVRTTPAPADEPAPPKSADETGQANGVNQTPPPDQPAAPQTQPQTQRQKEDEGGGAGGAERPRFVVQREALVIQSWEADFAKRLYPLMPTPRAAKRFTNIYRMLKAPVAGDRLELFEGTSSQPGQFQVPMLLLALSIGAAAHAAALFPALLRRAAQGDGLAKALTQLESDPAVGSHVAAVQARIGFLLQDPRFQESAAAAAALTEWVPRVARFSFDLGWAGGIQPAAASPAVQAQEQVQGVA